jgi:type IV pilus assembly protein PilC
MPNFRFDVRQMNGQVHSGVLAAPDITAASQILRSHGGQIVALSPMASASASGAGLMQRLAGMSFSPGPSQKDVLTFTQQLAVMIKAGINIRSAIEAIAEQIKSTAFRAIVTQVKMDVEAGKPFSEALSRHPKAFSKLYVNMVRASEMSGSFGHMLDRIAGYLGQQVETRRLVKGAMIYPIIIMCLAVSVTIFLLTYVLPRFMVIFKGKEEVLPLPTKLLLTASEGMVNGWYWVLLVLIAAVTGIYFALRTDSGRQFWDKAKLTVPIMRKLCKSLYIGRSLRTMGELINAGVPMLDTLAITGEVAGNIWYRRMWMNVHNAVKQGKKIASALTRTNLLPRSVVQMISAGEESGKLGETLDDVSSFYDKELQATIKNVTAMIEPIMIVLMGGVVGFIAMSIVLPIFKMSSLVKK